MNRVFSFVKSLRLSRVLTVFLLAVSFLVMQAFSFDYQFQAQAAQRSTPEADYYKVGDTNIRVNPRNDGRNNLPSGQEQAGSQNAQGTRAASRNAQGAQEGTKGTINNVVEKLNLREPIPQSTKEFVNDVKEHPGEILGDAVKGPKGAYEDYNRVRSNR